MFEGWCYFVQVSIDTILLYHIVIGERVIVFSTEFCYLNLF
jgi:hypothetical protein